MVVARDGDDEDLEFEDSPATPRRRRAAKPSGFVNAIAIIDMILGGLTLIGVPVQALQLLTSSQQAAQGPIPITVGPLNYLVLGVSALLGVCSLLASFFLLKGRSNALSFGWGAVGLTIVSLLLSVVVAIGTVSALTAAIPDESARSVATAAGYGGMAVTAAMRLGFLALYATALVQFKKWLDRNA